MTPSTILLNYLLQLLTHTYTYMHTPTIQRPYTEAVVKFLTKIHG
jgi:hypothetical protein